MERLAGRFLGLSMEGEGPRVRFAYPGYKSDRSDCDFFALILRERRKETRRRSVRTPLVAVPTSDIPVGFFCLR